MEKEIKLHVSGMTCHSCRMFVEERVVAQPGVKGAKVDLGKCELVLHIDKDCNTSDLALLASQLTKLVAGRGYVVSAARPLQKVVWGDFVYAVPVAGLFVLAFWGIQKLGLGSLIGGGSINLTTAFLVGIVASLSTCLAVVGGLILSLAGSYAKDGGGKRAIFVFHASRLISFFIFGGVVGTLGSFFSLGLTGTGILSLFVGAIMLILGFNQLEISHRGRSLQLVLPDFAGRIFKSKELLESAIAPVIFGAATFFLPCGFTQAMQFYALSTQSFGQGAMTMFAFALGTLPVLFLLSFSAFNFKDKTYAGIFWKTAGILIMLLAAVNILGGLAALGIIAPVNIFN